LVTRQIDEGHQRFMVNLQTGRHSILNTMMRFVENNSMSYSMRCLKLTHVNHS